MITDQEMQDLEEIRRLLDEAYDHYFTNSDGHCKSSEGYIGLNFPNYFERRDGQAFVVKGVEIYSYVLGSDRSHHFKSTAEALKTVQYWHDKEMQEDYEEYWEEDELDLDQLYSRYGTDPHSMWNCQ